MKRVFRFASAALLFAALVGCGGQQVGNQSLFSSATGSGAALGADTPTPAPTTTTAVTSHATTPPIAGTAATAAPRATATPKPAASQAPAAHLAIAVNGDNSGKTQFDPSVANVYPGTQLTWTNADTVTRSVVSDTAGQFSSGPIAPGASWSYTATAAGTYNYHDGTRPYAVASFTVVAR
jgi:plastocyanin